MAARGLRGLLAVLLLAVGMVVGVASVGVHHLPFGLPLAVAAPAAATWALTGGWSTRVSFVIGWFGVAAYAARRRPEGDYLVAADLQGYLLLGTGLVLLAVALATVRPLRPDAPSEARPGAGAVDS